MAKGYYLGVGDQTTCGGVIIEGDATHILMGKAVAREQDRVTCGKHPGTYIIVGHIPGDSIHGRKFAGTLNSQSNCPCKAWFIPSLVNDTYEFSIEGSSTSDKTQKNSEIDVETKNKIAKKTKIICAHTDSAAVVANYILSEIKINAKSDTAKQIRNLIDYDVYKQQMEDWKKAPWYTKLSGPPQPNIIAASTIWFMAVKTGAKWDHKPKIKNLFSKSAVARPLSSGNTSRSHYHKYKNHDYFYDVWSNIHYGYLGLSVGFSEEYLLLGSNLEQYRTSPISDADPIDDVTCMKIGYALFHKHGKYAETLKADDILAALEAVSDQALSESRNIHWCWNMENPDHIEKPKG
ncbi:polymorphic toxin type 44 domain-containing protein [Yersinia pseudotuberculosis]|uniref:polymorphic toxin type 44 domain-containing protein n=1 Tax=Yersinia pseudotuberculosis TaxID=633 RepID=UPI00061C0888|nr:polymorphic toxin type 44 domain-containing protein [Yersinia pseudotuberculosis]AXY34288.1 hypothetical protein CEQ20_13285 [Yersinia pseudotuberculosis]AYX09961.1 hypothetical protein EGX52_03415 [Yersinia pseudotuberculosis]MBO1568429.1 hypothetical protein [Yersinia pseudotuberculosis]MBO1605211.1 hypothetical protein [Yersinia pseudotuberculosis]PEI13852.1 hypothetical protein CRM78_11725 [Yersinia pseudotuberculosis]